tara:strand:- start:2506 stop:3183 length:678 start_codon:yes stop_codon:yes gene_type:complete
MFLYTATGATVVPTEAGVGGAQERPAHYKDDRRDYVNYEAMARRRGFYKDGQSLQGAQYINNPQGAVDILTNFVIDNFLVGRDLGLRYNFIKPPALLLYGIIPMLPYLLQAPIQGAGGAFALGVFIFAQAVPGFSLRDVVVESLAALGLSWEPIDRTIERGKEEFEKLRKKFMEEGPLSALGDLLKGAVSFLSGGGVNLDGVSDSVVQIAAAALVLWFITRSNQA